MQNESPREHIVKTLAACDYPGNSPNDRQVVRVARKWLAFLDSPHKTQGVVNGILEEFVCPEIEDGGCLWSTLKQRFLRWALETEWLEPPDVPRGHVD